MSRRRSLFRLTLGKTFGTIAHAVAASKAKEIAPADKQKVKEAFAGIEEAWPLLADLFDTASDEKQAEMYFLLGLLLAHAYSLGAVVGFSPTTKRIIETQKTTNARQEKEKRKSAHRRERIIENTVRETKHLTLGEALNAVNDRLDAAAEKRISSRTTIRRRRDKLPM